jgi:uncharacterized protein YkwD
MRWIWIDKFDYPYYAAGENLAMDFDSAIAVHQAFLYSPSQFIYSLIYLM